MAPTAPQPVQYSMQRPPQKLLLSLPTQINTHTPRPSRPFHLPLATAIAGTQTPITRHGTHIGRRPAQVTPRNRCQGLVVTDSVTDSPRHPFPHRCDVPGSQRQHWPSPIPVPATEQAPLQGWVRVTRWRGIPCPPTAHGRERPRPQNGRHLARQRPVKVRAVTSAIRTLAAPLGLAPSANAHPAPDPFHPIDGMLPRGTPRHCPTLPPQPSKSRAPCVVTPPRHALIRRPSHACRCIPPQRLLPVPSRTHNGVWHRPQRAWFAPHLTRPHPRRRSQNLQSIV